MLAVSTERELLTYYDDVYRKLDKYRDMTFEIKERIISLVNSNGFESVQPADIRNSIRRDILSIDRRLTYLKYSIEYLSMMTESYLKNNRLTEEPPKNLRKLVAHTRVRYDYICKRHESNKKLAYDALGIITPMNETATA
jgi:hypothetical protein